MRLLPVLVFVVACGGGGSDPEPLISGSLSASFDGKAFTPTNGFAVIKGDYSYLIVGSGNLHCGSENSNSPPSGYGAIFQLDTFDVGVHASLLTQMYSNEGGYHSTGTNSGSVTIAASTDMSVAGTLSYDYTDSDDGAMYSISGAFEAVRCP